MDERVLAADLQRHHGVTTRARLRASGLTEREITGLTRRGRLEIRGRGVLTDPASIDTFEQRVAVACALTGGIACFPTAGSLWEFRRTPKSRDIHISIPEQRRVRSLAGVVVHRSRQLPSTDIVTRRDGIAVTSPPRTIFDAAAQVSPADLESMIEQGLDRGNFTIATLSRTCGRLGVSGRPGGTQLAAVLAARPAWRSPSRSDYELRLERAMRARGFPPLVREHPVEIASGHFIHPDLGVPSDGFFVEVDHLTWHGGRLESDYDRWRDTKVRLAGACVERVSDVAIDQRLAETVEDLWLRWQQARRGRAASGTLPTAPPAGPRFGAT